MEVFSKLEWDLQDLYINELDWKRDISLLRGSINEFTAYKDKVISTSDNLYDAMELFCSINETANKIIAYANLNYDKYMDFKSQEMVETVQNVLSDFEEKTSFLNNEISRLSLERFDTYVREIPDLIKYQHEIKNILKEQNNNANKAKSESAHHFEILFASTYNTYQLLTQADFEFNSFTYADKEYEINYSNFGKLQESDVRTIRKKSYKEFYAPFLQYSNTLASLLNISVKKDYLEAKLNNYKDSLEYALSQERIPTNIFINLISHIKEQLGPLHKYVQTKKEALKVDQFHMYDFSAPLNKENLEIGFQSAKDLLFKSLKPLGEEYQKIITESFNNRWYNVNTNQMSISYAMDVPGSHPFILLNWKNRLNDLFTLSHELGHGAHYSFSSRDKCYPRSTPSIFISEIVATVNELLVIKHLIHSQRMKQLSILNYFIEKFRISFFHQILFAEFEYSIHGYVSKGYSLTSELLCNKYRELLKKYYGEELKLDEYSGAIWGRVPHFYSSFYVFKYATAFAAATKIVKKLDTEDGYKDKYVDLLKSSSSVDPLTLLEKSGIDFTGCDVISDCIYFFDSLVEQFKLSAT
ncbi:oligoendopeptidase F [Alteribacillus bidgolensis]|uniref:Oligoendopeptidase F n=2 Tax=Alteribacillus bidgolensis TaxID=930129 RepID=A0A1G8QPL9_9BACI|nr:oligoendopeptidase F [Alteribacillus bidgolensis]